MGCEPYTEKTCYTQNKESCVTKPFKNCTGVIETKVERVCFDVNELVCDLVEAIHYETLEETYQVQRCFTGKDRVCDTTYKIDMTTKDDYQCTNVETLTVTWRRRSSTTLHALTPWSSTVRGIKVPRTMVMDPRELSVQGSLHRAATTFPVRSKSRFARLTSTGTARNSLTSSPSLLRSRTVILSLRKSASLK